MSCLCTALHYIFSTLPALTPKHRFNLSLWLCLANRRHHQIIGGWKKTDLSPPTPSQQQSFRGKLDPSGLQKNHPFPHFHQLKVTNSFVRDSSSPSLIISLNSTHKSVNSPSTSSLQDPRCLCILFPTRT